MESSVLKKEFGKVDWQESWKLKTVTPEEWAVLKSELREAYQSAVSVIRNLEHWDGEDDIGASLAILAHTAYHLGAIRQILRMGG